MTFENTPDPARAAAGEILRLIHGEDLAGCTTPVDRVATIIAQASAGRASLDAEIMELQARVVEAVDLLSTPPPGAALEPAADLLPLLSQRLDSIHTITQKLQSTLAAIRGPAGAA